ncbi:MAG: Hsp70 family protein, partial [Nitrospirae bacterium]
SEEDGELILNRIAVGNHILVGGDNIDFTLAYAVSKHFTEKGIRLDTSQMLSLVYNCKIAKEKMLNDPDSESEQIVILGRGRGVVGGALKTELKRSEVENIIIDGFFPITNIDDMPKKKVSGFKELGLHYESDTAITKHLAKFLKIHAKKLELEDKSFIHPTGVLFNGGVTKSVIIRERIIDVLNRWVSAENGEEVKVITGDNPDLAVSMGASFYGLAKRGRGIRIRGGTSRAYYVGIETAMPAIPGMPTPIKALCVVPFGMEEGTDVEIRGQEFGLVIGEHATFRFLSSVVRKDDKAGTIVEYWEEDEIEELAPLETTITAEGIEGGTVIPVRLHSFVTEIGTLQLWCESVDGKYRWKLEFNLREEEEE